MNQLVVSYSVADGMRRVPTQFATSGYYSVQLGEGKLFQVLHCSPGCRMLERRADGYFGMVGLPYPGEVRDSPALCNVADRFVYLIGGKSGDTFLNTISRYSVAEKTWSDAMPPMNEGRMLTSACYISGKIYVVAGKGVNGHLNSIEWCKVHEDPVAQAVEVWTKIFPPNIAPEFVPRFKVCVARLNSTEIVIMGGTRQ